jgi:hypothetical protein
VHANDLIDWHVAGMADVVEELFDDAVAEELIRDEERFRDLVVQLGLRCDADQDLMAAHIQRAAGQLDHETAFRLAYDEDADAIGWLNDHLHV